MQVDWKAVDNAAARYEEDRAGGIGRGFAQ
jgi:hypothetical protein